MSTKPVNDTLQLIGNTPVYQIKDSNVYVKLEKYNAGGSVKDRAVYGMLKDAQDKGLIKPDTILVEATSGNTGIALAMLGAVLGIKVVILMPESMSKERRELVKAYGAQLILTPKATGMKGALAKAQEILDANPSAVTLGQFVNPANPAIHYETTGAEIFEQVPNVGIVVAGIGTGGTFTGVARKLKELKKDVKAVAVEPAGSPMISEGKGGAHKIQGIGAGFIPENFDRSLMDEVKTVSDEEAIAQVETFMRETGISIGISAGAAIKVAKDLGAQNPGVAVVAIAPDGVEKYLSMLEFGDVEYVKA
ncbi:PLP-dependent cysteine synthase family protein [uncultured Veillonella sp.]|uniref:PLP-dependent cysteine synthase family protein n=1 Tax=uncultured Veillonella sp. TaxID=159268 RepID=UPI002630D070|nr:cysteine synthase [uncultured Veillonella sp.]